MPQDGILRPGVWIGVLQNYVPMTDSPCMTALRFWWCARLYALILVIHELNTQPAERDCLPQMRRIRCPSRWFALWLISLTCKVFKRIIALPAFFPSHDCPTVDSGPQLWTTPIICGIACD